MAKRGKQPNISFFAFTATPKYKTMEVFGQPGPDGKPLPFHLYGMRQATRRVSFSMCLNTTPPIRYIVA